MAEHITGGCIIISTTDGSPTPGTVHAYLSGKVFQSLPIALGEGHSTSVPGSPAEATRRIPVAAGAMHLDSLNGDLTLRLNWAGEQAPETLLVLVELGVDSALQSRPHTITTRLRLTSAGGPQHVATACLARHAHGAHGDLPVEEADHR